MRCEINENIPKPKIVTDEDLTLKEFSNLLGYDDDFFSAMCPYYFHKENMILIIMESRLDSLAHEFVHYFQVKYKNADFEMDYVDNNEFEAVHIQHWFKEKYMK